MESKRFINLKERKLIKIEKAKNIIFIGDTHGDFGVSRKIVRDYLKPENILVFLGDYIDRGFYSKENLDFLLGTKKEISKPNLSFTGKP